MEVEDFIEGFEGDDHEIMKFLNEMMIDQPGISSKISFKIPFYYRNSWICYINPVKKGGIEFVFTCGKFGAENSTGNFCPWWRI